MKFKAGDKVVFKNWPIMSKFVNKEFGVITKIHNYTGKNCLNNLCLIYVQHDPDCSSLGVCSSELRHIVTKDCPNYLKCIN